MTATTVSFVSLVIANTYLKHGPIELVMIMGAQHAQFGLPLQPDNFTNSEIVVGLVLSLGLDVLLPSFLNYMGNPVQLSFSWACILVSAMAAFSACATIGFDDEEEAEELEPMFGPRVRF